MCLVVVDRKENLKIKLQLTRVHFFFYSQSIYHDDNGWWLVISMFEF